jgi:hypothetical protein
MNDFFYSGLALELALFFMFAELVILVLLYRHRAVRFALLDVLIGLLPGVFLMLGMYYAVLGRPWYWLAGCLIGSLAAHTIDLRRRWLLKSPNELGSAKANRGSEPLHARSI